MDWMLDEWLKLGYEPQQNGTIVLVDSSGAERTGSLGFRIDEDTGEWHWQHFGPIDGSTNFDEFEIERVDDEAARIVLKRLF